MIIEGPCNAYPYRHPTVALSYHGNGKPYESVGRKATGLIPVYPEMAARLPDDEYICLKNNSLR
jgi:hypothetical protein